MQEMLCLVGGILCFAGAAVEIVLLVLDCIK